MATRWPAGDAPIAVVDGLEGFPEAIEAAFPGAVARTVGRARPTVHPIRRSLEAMA